MTAAPHYEVNGSGQGWIIADHLGQPVNGKVYRCQHIAATRAHNLENIARFAAINRIRDCLCCGVSFKSQGPHNRLCNPCRQRF